MTIRHLEAFLAIADAGGYVTRAAEALHVSQPALSRTLANLEAHYGAPLFDRLGHRLILSSAGRALLPRARRMVDEFRTLDRELCESSPRMPLRIGASYTVGTAFLPPILKKLSREPEPFRCEVVIRNTALIETALLESTLDIAILEGAIHSRDLIETVVGHDEVIAVIQPGREKTDDCPWILREPSSGTHDAAIAAFGIPPGAPVWSVANTQTQIAMAEAGLGIAVLSGSLVREALTQKRIIRHGKTAVRRTYRLVHHRDKFMDERMTRFCAAVTAHA